MPRPKKSTFPSLEDDGSPQNDDRLIGQILGVDAEPVLPGFEMSDEPLASPAGPPTSPAGEMPPPPASMPAPSERAGGGGRVAKTNGAVSKQPVRYESRIEVREAWQYPGFVQDAPPWIDRNWIGWADYDELRHIPQGPCLRVPIESGLGVVRKGDYVVQQLVRADDGSVPTRSRIEVWPREEFERLFVGLSG